MYLEKLQTDWDIAKATVSKLEKEWEAERIKQESLPVGERDYSKQRERMPQVFQAWNRVDWLKLYGEYWQYSIDNETGKWKKG